MTTALTAYNTDLVLAGPIGSLERYMHVVSGIPVLTREQEIELANRLREDNDLEAARQLVLSHLRFVVHIARGYSGYGLNLGDLVQEGNVGLMKAVKRFDPGVGVRLVSFAVHWIRAEIHEFILRNWRLVKVATTKAQRKLFFNLRKAKKRLSWLTQDETEAVARDLGVSPREVTEMEQRLAARALSFDPLSSRGERLVCCRARGAGLAAGLFRSSRCSAGNAGRAEPGYPLAALAEREKIHAARAGCPVQRVSRAHPSDRGQRPRQTARPDGHLSPQHLRKPKKAGHWPAFFGEPPQRALSLNTAQ